MTLAAVLVVRGTAAADRPVHELQITASRYAFDPATIQVNAGELVRIVIRSTDGVHGFSIPKLEIDVRVQKSGDAAIVEFTATPIQALPSASTASARAACTVFFLLSVGT